MNPLLFTPLSLSRLFKEKGVKQESMFYWVLTHFENNDISPDLYLDNPIWELRNENIKFDDAVPTEDFLPAYSLSELPDVFRQVFGIGKKLTDYVQWAVFCDQYFQDPATAWENLEKTIKQL